jgi:hypothetical protein
VFGVVRVTTLVSFLCYVFCFVCLLSISCAEYCTCPWIVHSWMSLQFFTLFYTIIETDQHVYLLISMLLNIQWLKTLYYYIKCPLMLSMSFCFDLFWLIELSFKSTVSSTDNVYFISNRCLSLILIVLANNCTSFTFFCLNILQFLISNVYLMQMFRHQITLFHLCVSVWQISRFYF